MKTAAGERPPIRFDAVHRFSVDEYYRLMDVGLLEEDTRVELLDGQLIPMAPIGPEHHWILEALNDAFTRQRDDRYRVGPGRSLPIPDRNVPEPDMVLYRPGITRRRHVSVTDVLLVIEIAGSSLMRDLGFKADLYRDVQIPEYWVVDVQNQSAHLLRLNGARYEKKTVFEGKISPRALPDIEIDLASLFGP